MTVGTREDAEGSGRREHSRERRVKRDDFHVNERGVFILNGLDGSRKVRDAVGKDEQMRFRRAEKVVDAFAFDFEIRETVSGFNFEDLGRIVSAQNVFVVADADLRYER